MGFLSRSCHATPYLLPKYFKFFFMISWVVLSMILNASDSFAQQYNFTIDFEDGNLRGWTAEGEAFRFQPTWGDNPTSRNRDQASNHQGNYWIGTYERYQRLPGQRAGEIQGDGPVGSLTSSSFVIPKGILSFLVGGGNSFETRVELLVEDPMEGNIRVYYATGGNTETMSRKSWDLTAYAGKKGRIRIVDASSGGWGHINADDFRFPSGTVDVADPNKIMVPPVARILPQYHEVIQGEDAIFESRSSSAGRIIRETWLGPDRLKGRGSRFIVSTRGLSPGSYEINLSVLDSYEQKGEASTTLVIKPQEEVTYRLKARALPDTVREGERVRLVADLAPDVEDAEFSFTYGDGVKSDWTTIPETEHTYSSPGQFYAFVSARSAGRIIARSGEVKVTVTESMPDITVSYNVQLRPDKDRVFLNGAVTFNTILHPGDQTVQYKFLYGDGTESAWLPSAESVHVYAEPGEYRAMAAVMKDGKIIAESRPAGIVVEEASQYPFGSSQVTDSDPSPDNTFAIILTFAAATVIFLVGYAIRCLRKRKKNTLQESMFRFQVVPHFNQGEQFIGSDHPLDTDYELQIIHGIDHGVQEIVAG
jgi:hypothetical protein